jgi:hypothetical protein
LEQVISLRNQSEHFEHLLALVRLTQNLACSKRDITGAAPKYTQSALGG